MIDAIAPRRLGSLGEVGPIALGQWRFTGDDVASAQALVEAALDAGVNLVDTADVYGLDWGGTGFGACEELLGRVLAGRALAARADGAGDQGRDRPADAVRLQPRVSAGGVRGVTARGSASTSSTSTRSTGRTCSPIPPRSPPRSTALREEGKIREVGVSNHTVAQVEALRAHLPFPIVSNQPEYSAVHLDPLRDGTFDDCMRNGVVPLVWSPLAGGLLATGDGVPAELLAVLDGLAERESVDRATVALAFALAHPSRPVAIIGTQKPERIAAALAALQVRLDRADVYAIIQASEGVPLP